MAAESHTEASRSLTAWIEELFVAHVEGVYNVAYRVVWNTSDADDVVQATFVKAFSRIGQLTDTGKVRSWLLQVAYREAITIVRRRRDVPMDPADIPPERCGLPGPAETAVASAVAAEISSALQRLEPDERLAVVLRDIEGLPMREVAEVVGIGLSAAKMRVHRGRQSLRTMLEKSEIW